MLYYHLKQRGVTFTSKANSKAKTNNSGSNHRRSWFIDLKRSFCQAGALGGKGGWLPSTQEPHFQIATVLQRLRAKAPFTYCFYCFQNQSGSFNCKDWRAVIRNRVYVWQLRERGEACTHFLKFLILVLLCECCSGDRVLKARKGGMFEGLDQEGTPFLLAKMP
jgi:hypothetical protein